MKKLLICLCLLLFAAARAEENCPVCGESTPECTVDASGAIYCTGTLVHYPAEQTAECYTVRAGTRYIGAYAFAGNDTLMEVRLPEGVVMVDDGAFEGCTALHTVSLPETLLIIGDSAFYECVSLPEVTLPSRLYAIGASAFVDCWKLERIDIPETVRYIGAEAFCNSGLKEIWLRMICLDCGETILHPGYSYDPAPPVTIHMCDAVIEEELGTAMNFYLTYADQPNLTFVFDIPYGSPADSENSAADSD